MSIHYAPARARTSDAAPLHPTVAKALTARARDHAANDDDGAGRATGGAYRGGVARPGPEPLGDEVLRAALRHFARHGLGAARAARQQADAAFFAGDRGAYDRWVQITRILDRRLAAGIGSAGERPHRPCEP